MIVPTMTSEMTSGSMTWLMILRTVTMSKSLLEILDELFMVGAVYDHISSSTKFAKEQTSEAQSLIYIAGLDVIGDDDKFSDCKRHWSDDFSIPCTCDDMPSNKLRQEQRLILKQFCFGSGNLSKESEK